MASASELPRSCRLCQSISSDPAVLSCTHCFCRVCLQKNWKDQEIRKCPVCGRRSSMDWIPPDMSSEYSPPPSKRVCRLHSEELSLFCADHQEALCAVCREDHTDHCLRPIEEGVPYLRDKLLESLPRLKSRLRLLDKAEPEFRDTDGFISAQAKRTEKLIREQFQKLRRLLQEEEESRVRAVKEEEEQKRKRLEGKRSALRRQTTAVRQIIRDTEKELSIRDTEQEPRDTEELQELPSDQPLDLSLLLRYRSLVERVERPLQEEEPQLGSGALLDQAKHLGNLGFHIWSSLQSQVQYSPVVLDPNTAHPKLTLSEDLTTVKRGGEKLPKNPVREMHFVCVLGSEGLSSGTHSWDVDVSVTHWALGVATKTEEGRVCEMWRLWFYRGKYRWWTHPGQPTDLQFSADCEKIRVVLDMDQGQLSFYDAGSQSLIHSFTHPFTGNTLYPLFYVYDVNPIKILPQAVEVTVSPTHGHISEPTPATP